MNRLNAKPARSLNLSKCTKTSFTTLRMLLMKKSFSSMNGGNKKSS